MSNSYSVEAAGAGHLEINGHVPIHHLPELGKMFGLEIDQIGLSPPELDGSADSLADHLGIDETYSDSLNIELACFLPDNMPPQVAQKLARSVLEIVQDNPGISYGVVLNKVADFDLFKSRRKMSLASLMTCAGVVAIAHKIGSESLNTVD